MQTVTLALPSGSRRAYVAEATAPTGRAVVVLHELLGLNDDMARICDRFAEAGYLAVAPDLFEGLGMAPFCVARAMRALADGGGPVLAIVQEIADVLGEREDVDRQAIGVAGFCMGGGFAVLAAGSGAFTVAAPFYGDVPRDPAKVPALCPTVASFGGKDLVFRGGADRLREHLERAEVPHDVKLYPEAGHSFMSIHRPALRPLGYLPPMFARHHPEAAADAWERVLTFFDRHLSHAPV